jgi:hypothetical protein
MVTPVSCIPAMRETTRRPSLPQKQEDPQRYCEQKRRCYSPLVPSTWAAGLSLIAEGDKPISLPRLSLRSDQTDYLKKVETPMRKRLESMPKFGSPVGQRKRKREKGVREKGKGRKGVKSLVVYTRSLTDGGSLRAAFGGNCPQQSASSTSHTLS